MTLIVVFLLAALAQAQTFTTLYSFTGGSDGGNPGSAVIQDPSGNLYGTAYLGGNLNDCVMDGDRGCGVVFKLNIAGTETVLYTFCSKPNCVDGAGPGTPLVRDRAGNLYGTATNGGSSNCTNGCGVVFKIDKAGRESVLYSFTGGEDGCNPAQGLIMSATGELFGTTDCGSGTIFKVNRAGKFTLLHSFTGAPSDGAAPTYGHLTMDKGGNLYGVSWGGGAYDQGALYKLSRSGTLTLLHSFAAGTTDGCFPLGSVLRDKSGSVYGTTEQCGSDGDGIVWKISKSGKETILHNFIEGGSDGCESDAGVTQDSKGNLYGVTAGCGAGGDGALYELSAKRKLTLLHSFDGSDGDTPIGEVLRVANGTLFGTAVQGGSGDCGKYGMGCGTVWKYVP